MAASKDIIIVGAGLVGSLLSIFLSRRGYKVKVFERRPDMRREKVAAGRSINLALSDRGIKALNEAGIVDDIMQIAIPMPGRYIHNPDGTHAFQPYGKEGQAIYSVSRSELNKKLIDLAEAQNIDFHFNHKCISVDWKQNEINFEKESADSKTSSDSFTPTIQFEKLFAADGAFSAVRTQHMLHHSKFDYQQSYIDCGYKELTIPANDNGLHVIEKNALHIWPRKDYMLIALPNLDGSFTCTLFFPFEGPLSFEKLDTAEKVNQFFNDQFADVVPLIPNITEQFFHNPVSSLVTVKCNPWIRGNHFTLIGDAAHAIVPFFGQGMNCGFEDCTILGNLMDKYGDDWSTILQLFEETRKPDADAIADLAVNNFTEMRHKTADSTFLLQKKIEAKLHDKYPDLWIPAYSQVTFSPHIRYSEALRRGEKQELIMQRVMQMPDIETKWQDDAIEKFILEQLEKES